MFGISFSEIILIFIIALLVLGPKQLHNITLKAREFIVAFRRFSTNLKKEVYEQSGLNELQNTKHMLLNGYQDLKSSIISTHYTSRQTNVIEEPIQAELEFDKEPELF